MTDEQKNFIDNASYYELLSIWRFSKSGNPLLKSGNDEDSAGDYFSKIMFAKRDAMDKESPGSSSLISKELGWGN